uniref:Uncharacterized protein n=1 Tax=Anguilla anguilla TaxID=7936 RepID=A0A0E9UXF6_ANGAN
MYTQAPNFQDMIDLFKTFLGDDPENIAVHPDAIAEDDMVEKKLSWGIKIVMIMVICSCHLGRCSLLLSKEQIHLFPMFFCSC